MLPLLLGACAPRLSSAAAGPDELTVFAAASLTDAFREIGAAFEAARPGVRVAFNFGGTQSLRTQLEQGAMGDVFASANQDEMQALIDASLIRNASVRVFVTNRLVVVLPEDNPAGITRLEDLARPGLKLALAAPEVPAGRYAREVLDKLERMAGTDFLENVLRNVVSNEYNVKQVLAKVRLGEVDAGLVYLSDAVAAPALRTIVIPAEFNVVAEYPIAVLSHAPHPDLARVFVDYVLSPDGQAVLSKWGFTPAYP